MGKKAKPVKDLENIVDAKYPSDDTLISIKAECGIALDEDCTRELRKACRTYFGDKKVLNKWPRNSNVKAALAEIKQKAEDLEEILNRADFVSIYQLSRHLSYGRFDLCRNLRELIFFAENEIENTPIDKGGAPKDHALDYFIENLAYIFKDATNTRPTPTTNSVSNAYEGKFYLFVHTCIKHIDPGTAKHLTNNGLGQRIERVLKALKL